MAERNYTSSEILLMTKVRKSNTKCYYCGCIVEESKRTVDHKIPVSRGGLTKQDNLVMSCKECNTEKDFLTEEEYKEFLDGVSEEIEGSISIKSLNSVLNTYKEIIDNIEKNKIKLKKCSDEVEELENIIRDSKLSASDGYKLCKMLQDNLKGKDEARKNLNDLRRINKEVYSDYKNTNERIDSIRNKIRSQYKRKYINSKDITLR